MSSRIMLLTVTVICLLATAAQAQVTREGGAGSIAGTLQKTVDNYDDYQFFSKGNQVLFVDLDADLYINDSSSGGHETEDEDGCEGGGGGGSGGEGGCGDEGEPGEEEGCGGEGKSRFVLVLDNSQNQVCVATKPTKPGWDTDPRMACLLADKGNYILRVGFAGTEEHDDVQTGTPKIHPYLLNVSLREIADEASEIQLGKAIKDSVNRLPFRD